MNVCGRINGGKKNTGAAAYWLWLANIVPIKENGVYFVRREGGASVWHRAD